MAIAIEKTPYGFLGRFQSMASPCEILIESGDVLLAHQISQCVADEAWRIEAKYSRYKPDNLCAAINQSSGQPVPIDEETFQLLSFANTCFEISGGQFDLTAGVLRRAWTFKPESQFPSSEQVNELLPLIGWQKIGFTPTHVTLPPGMEIDFGGIGKEYAVDLASQAVIEKFPGISVVVNFGGDLRTTCPPKHKPYWEIGVDSLMQGIEKAIRIGVGAVCTSGDTERFIIHQGQRYCHILNPTTGYPVKGSPKTVTVIADQCLQAGLMSTLAMLQGETAEAFLESQGVKFFCQR